jgi:hypothetical protein
MPKASTVEDALAIFRFTIGRKCISLSLDGRDLPTMSSIMGRLEAEKVFHVTTDEASFAVHKDKRTDGPQAGSVPNATESLDMTLEARVARGDLEANVELAITLPPSDEPRAVKLLEDAPMPGSGKAHLVPCYHFLEMINYVRYSSYVGKVLPQTLLRQYFVD